MTRTLAFNHVRNGFSMSAFYVGDSQDADIEIKRDGQPYKAFKWPKYRIWNLLAHFENVIESELANIALETKRIPSDD